MTCPACRDPVKLSGVVRTERLLQRLIGSLQVKMQPTRSAGCRATMNYGIDGDGLRTHLQLCPYSTTSCQRCSWTGARSLQASHVCTPPQSGCPNPGCSFVGVPNAISQHVVRCKYKVLHCDACNNDYPRHNAAYHEQRDCIYRCVHCHIWIAESRRAEHQHNASYLRLCSRFRPCENGCGQPVLRGVQNKHDDTCLEASVTCNACPATCKRKNFDKHWDKVHSDEMDY